MEYYDERLWKEQEDYSFDNNKVNNSIFFGDGTTAK
jgi:hypothetical protein